MRDQNIRSGQKQAGIKFKFLILKGPKYSEFSRDHEEDYMLDRVEIETLVPFLFES